MPHNMFGKCLSAEIADRELPECQSEGPPSLEPVKRAIALDECLPEEQSFMVGTAVVIEGLVKAPVFNGACGTVHSLDAESGRYNVFLATPTPSGQRWAKIKGENLRAL